MKDEAAMTGSGERTIGVVSLSEPSGWHIEPGRLRREWMDATADRGAYRCLPMNIANCAGWVIRAPEAVHLRWDGHPSEHHLHILSADGNPGPAWAASHFGDGIVSFHIPYLFRTPSGVQLYIRGPSNFPKHGVYPLEGIVETDWLPYPFTMSWKLTAPTDSLTFEAGEPICQVSPVSLGWLEAWQPEFRDWHDEPALEQEALAWERARQEVLANPAEHQRGQLDYVKGRSPGGQAAKYHWPRLRLRAVGNNEATSGHDEERGPSCSGP